MYLGSGGGQSHAGGPEKFDFPENFSKGHRLAHYLFIFHVKFIAVGGIFVSFQAWDIITIHDFLVSWKIFVCETLNLTPESRIRSC